MRPYAYRHLLLLCSLVVVLVVVCEASEKICNCQHCQCASVASRTSRSSVGAAEVNSPVKVAYVADEVLSSFPTCKDCGEYHARPRNDHSSAQIYRQEARRVEEPCRCQLKDGNNNELRTTIRLEPVQQEVVTKLVSPSKIVHSLPKSSPKSEQIPTASVPSNIARIAKKKELLKKESETVKPIVIDFEQLQKLLTSGSLTNAPSDKDKVVPTPIILYVVAPNAAYEKAKPIETAKTSEPISEPATTPKARANNDSEPLRMTQLAGTSTPGYAKKFRRSPNLRQRRLEKSTPQASSTTVPTIRALKTTTRTTTTTTTTSAPRLSSPPRPLGQWLRGLKQSTTAESSSSSSSSDNVTERSKRWIKNPTNGHAAPTRPPPVRSPAVSKRAPAIKTLRRINGSDQRQPPLESPDSRLTLSSLEKSFTAAKKKKAAILKKRLSPAQPSPPAPSTTGQEDPRAPRSPASKPAFSSASKLALGDSSDCPEDQAAAAADQPPKRYKLVRRHLSGKGYNDDYWIMRIPKRNESTFATVIADAAHFVAKLFSNGRRSYDRD